MDPLRNYLAWQAEMGGDEVMLAAPLIPVARAAAVETPMARGAALSPTSLSMVSGAATAAPSDLAGAGLYEMLAKSLQDSQSTARDNRMKASPMASMAAAATITAKPAESSLPVFDSLAECRTHAEQNLKALHTGDPDGAGWQVVHGEGPEFAPLALAVLEPGAEDGPAGHPFQGPGGILLEKMMRAIKLDMASLYRTTVVKVAAPRKVWTRRDLVRLLPLFQAELALAKVPVVLLLGEACAQAVLKTGKPLEELVQRFHTVEGAPGIEFAVTWHPDDLEGKEELKRKAWKDLQWLQPRLQGK